MILIFLYYNISLKKLLFSFLLVLLTKRTYKERIDYIHENAKQYGVLQKI